MDIFYFVLFKKLFITEIFKQGQDCFLKGGCGAYFHRQRSFERISMFKVLTCLHPNVPWSRLLFTREGVLNTCHRMAASGPRGLLSSLIQECQEAITGLVCVCGEH